MKSKSGAGFLYHNSVQPEEGVYVLRSIVTGTSGNRGRIYGAFKQ